MSTTITTATAPRSQQSWAAAMAWAARPEIREAVRRIAGRWRMPLADAHQEAMLVFFEHSDDWDPNRGVPFDGYLLRALSDVVRRWAYQIPPTVTELREYDATAAEPHRQSANEEEAFARYLRRLPTVPRCVALAAASGADVYDIASGMRITRRHARRLLAQSARLAAGAGKEPPRVLTLTAPEGSA